MPEAYSHKRGCEGKQRSICAGLLQAAQVHNLFTMKASLPRGRQLLCQFLSIVLYIVVEIFPCEVPFSVIVEGVCRVILHEQAFSHGQKG